MKLLAEMIKLATNAHHGQFDKGGKPYILHPLAVMNILNSDDEELNCIAVGHDLIEDTNVTHQYLVSSFGYRVANTIRVLTKWEGYNAARDYEEYKGVILLNRDAMLVKAADLTHNCDIRRLKGVTKKDHARIAKYHEFYMEIQKCLK